MKSVSYQTLLFAIFSLIFIILLVFLSSEFQPYPLISLQDAFDLFTPLVLIPIYWLLFKSVSSDSAKRNEEIAFLIMAAIWVEGQGMHLSANSINNLIGTLARGQIIDVTTTDIHRLTYFFDEYLSHVLWHIGVLGLAALLVYREWRRPAGDTTSWWAVAPAGVFYGFTYFCIFLEGQTAVIGFPFAVIFVTFTLLSQRKHLHHRPVLAFFFISCSLALLLFTGWGLYYGGFPQFTDVGLI